MAKPQKENGYVSIANELFEALARTRIPGEARQVLDVIIRLTYGWNRKQTAISYREFMDMTGLDKGHTHRALKVLLEHKLIDRAGDKFCLQKDHEIWVPFTRYAVAENGYQVVAENGYRSSRKRLPSSSQKRLPKVAESGYSDGHNDKPDNNLQAPKDSKDNVKPSLSCTSVLDKTIEQSSCQAELRETLASLIRKKLKNLPPIPDSIPTLQLEYLLWLLEARRVDPRSIRNPLAYLMALKVVEEFPTCQERLEAKAAEEKTRREELGKKHALARKQEEESLVDQETWTQTTSHQIREFIRTVLGPGGGKSHAKVEAT